MGGENGEKRNVDFTAGGGGAKKKDKTLPRKGGKEVWSFGLDTF
jgi:hypothetical protein